MPSQSVKENNHLLSDRAGEGTYSGKLCSIVEWECGLMRGGVWAQVGTFFY